MKFHSDDLGKLFLRLAFGGLMLFHGIQKLRTGVGGIEGMLTGIKLPGFLAYGVFIGEVLAPLLILVGFFTRPAGLVLAFNMVVAIALAHTSQILTLNAQSGAWGIELQGLYLLGGLALFFMGAGRFSVSRGQGRWD